MLRTTLRKSIPARRLLSLPCYVRTYATPADSTHALVFIEHRDGALDSGSLSAVTAARQLGGKVTGLIVGAEGIDGVVEKAKKLKGVSKLLHSSSKLYDPPLAETISEIIHRIVSTSPDYTHVVSAHSALGKSVLPRVAGTLDLPAISDVTSVEHDSASNATTFTRPIYAGNAIATVKAPGSVNVKFFTVRGTAFDATTADEVSESVEVEKVEPVDVPDLHTKHVSASLTKSSRPELSSATRVVSGGRALKSAESFNSTLDPLADVLGAAVGASRAAVDSGYADNSLQVGQTGKVVAPELYVAVGISGAIQHLAGMKDSKCIVAINKDAEAPIFQVADIGLVADLYQAVPELVEKLKAQQK